MKALIQSLTLVTVTVSLPPPPPLEVAASLETPAAQVLQSDELWCLSGENDAPQKLVCSTFSSLTLALTQGRVT